MDEAAVKCLHQVVELHKIAGESPTLSYNQIDLAAPNVRRVAVYVRRPAGAKCGQAFAPFGKRMYFCVAKTRARLGPCVCFVLAPAPRVGAASVVEVTVLNV